MQKQKKFLDILRNFIQQMKMKKLYNRLYYFVSFIPKRTVNDKIHGTAHHMTNKELYKMRTQQIIQMFTFRNVIIYKFHKLSEWIRKFPLFKTIFTKSHRDL